jgi:mono/diheme cytochrome c family protein
MHSRFLGTAGGWLLWSVVALAAEPQGRPLSPQERDFFEKQVRPVLVENCFACHGPKKQQAGLRLDSRPALLKGGDSGPALVPGDPDKSLLVQAVRQTGDVKKMPPKTKLKPDAVDALAAWVKMGAPWPEDTTASADREAWKRHWAFQSRTSAGRRRRWTVSSSRAWKPRA